MEQVKEKMQVEVWSDIMCPFCYLGKRKFEMALSQFPHANDIEITWKSFQLMPSLKTDTTISIHDFLAKEKGFPVTEAKKMNQQVTEMGEKVGLTYRFDQVVVANTFNAHRLLHLAKVHGLQNEAEETLFKAFFTEGKNVDDPQILIALGKEIGINEESLQHLINSNQWSDQVQSDIREAQQLGIRGVPYFVLDRKYAVSGAQDSSAFLAALAKSHNEWKGAAKPVFSEVLSGEVCKPGERCD